MGKIHLTCDWYFEYSSGYAGYRNFKTGEWRYLNCFIF